MLAAYLVPVDDAEEGLLGRYRAALDDLEDLGLRDLPVGYRVAAELARAGLASIPGSRGQYLARGVTVASFVPMRAIPFRVVFVLGLGQGDFPRNPRRGDLDLREARREPGDVTPREQDLYMFLETLLCARDRLVLSYLGRDEITGEQRPPSPVLLELREILSNGYLVDAEVKNLFEAEPPPLRRYADIERLDALPLARGEHAAQLLGESLRASLPAGTAAPASVEDLRRALAAPAFAEVASRLSLPAPLAPAAQANEETTTVKIALADLRRFLEDPLQGSARFRLRLREAQSDDELADREDESIRHGCVGSDEPSSRSHDQNHVGSRRPCHRPRRWPPCYDDIGLREELAGRAPAGLFRAGRAPAPHCHPEQVGRAAWQHCGRRIPARSRVVLRPGI